MWIRIHTHSRRAAAAVFLLLIAASNLPPAHAAGDPHIPDMGAGYCPGGGAGSQIYVAYCDGVPYADGSFWHALQYGYPMIGHPYGLLSPGLQCVIGAGPIPAPDPGGCGGAG